MCFKTQTTRERDKSIRFKLSHTTIKENFCKWRSGQNHLHTFVVSRESYHVAIYALCRVAVSIIVKQKWFEKISSPHIIRICLGVLRTLGLYINFHQSAINDHPCCVLTHASPLSVLQHALRRKCSLMATPPKRDSVNDQSSFKFRSVDSQTISFWL